MMSLRPHELRPTSGDGLIGDAKLGRAMASSETRKLGRAVAAAAPLPEAMAALVLLPLMAALLGMQFTPPAWVRIAAG